ncbi:MAG TPA: hypothetical protein VMZ91_14470 [Candidatus Paceibacterota bacterium]|nr:hypothetical protein [Candidatus Paceibacterota bacterium]
MYNFFALLNDFDYIWFKQKKHEFMNDNEIENTDMIMPPNELIFEENKTYCRVGSTDDGTIELDLRIKKEKGAEERHISFSTIGFNSNNDIVECEVKIKNEESFKKFKAFIEKLNWND